MKIKILTLFPNIVEAYFKESIMARAVENGLIEYQIINIRDYTEDKHNNCDDYPYGGGAGMVFMPQPLGSALEAVISDNSRVVYVSPSGKKFNHDYAVELSSEDEIVIICGRYEGIDQRIIDKYVSDEITIGDYVISSGEVAALVLVDALYRHIDGVISKESLKEESFANGNLLEYPHYTRPVEYCGMRVPDILLSGNHAKIEEWRNKKRFEKTLKNRPELLEENWFF